MMLSILTAALSSVLDNVTTVLLMIPVVNQLCEVRILLPCPLFDAMGEMDVEEVLAHNPLLHSICFCFVYYR
jgi:hypothetical protein